MTRGRGDFAVRHGILVLVAFVALTGLGACDGVRSAGGAERTADASGPTDTTPTPRSAPAAVPSRSPRPDPTTGSDLPVPTPTSATGGIRLTTPEPTAPAFGPTGPTEEATVSRVIDGDTIEVVLGGRRVTVRYIGIDTPETVAPGQPVEWMGPEASDANRRLVDGRRVILEKDVSETDRFGRLLRYVWIPGDDGLTLANLELVALGYAAVSTFPPDVKYADLFLAAQREARDAGRGLWGAAPPTPPPARATPPPPPPPPASTSGGGDCHSSYDACLPIVGDLDCADVRALGVAPVRVIGPDDYRLDRDRDGLGCE